MIGIMLNGHRRRRSQYSYGNSDVMIHRGVLRSKYAERLSPLIPSICQGQFLVSFLPCVSNVRVLSEALLGADRQEPLVGVSISVCVSLAVHIDRDLNERGWP